MSNNAKNLPEVKLGQYKGLAVTRHVRPLSEKTIDQEMVHQTRMRSVYHNSTAPAKRGSRVLLDFVGFMDGEEIPDSRMEKVMVVLGDGKLMPAAEDAIYGHIAGETFRFDFTYPEQFRVEELSGKTAQFEIKLHSVAEKTTPELNEEFARAQGYADLAAMREAVRAKKRKIHEDAADRAAGQRGLCGADDTLRVARAALHHWDAPCLSGDPSAETGSGTVFFSGCTLRCCYCQNYPISQGEVGKAISVERLAEIFMNLQNGGAKNLNLVTASQYLPWVTAALDQARTAGFCLPVVYNTGVYETVEAVKALAGYVDIWLADYKYADGALAAELSAAQNYPAVADAALRQMLLQTGAPVYDADG